MTIATESVATTPRTLADLIEDLGNVPLERVLANPPPGTATTEDVLRLGNAVEKRICELIDSVLVEKAPGFLESTLAAVVIRILGQFVRDRSLGIVVGEQGTIALSPQQVRIPDVAFYSYRRLPGGRVPSEPIPAIAPDLAIEILSPSNTAGEMRRKRRDYFNAGVRLIWEIDPRTRSAVVWTDVEHATSLVESDLLIGSDVLPGFSVRLGDLFAELDPPAAT